MKRGKTIPLEKECNIEYGTRVVRKRDGGSVYPVYGGGGETFKVDEFNREDRLVIARFGMSEECTRFVAGKFFLNDSGLTVSPKNGSMLQQFLDYQILALNDDIYALGKGTAQKNLDVPVFRKLPLFVPGDIIEQQRIVGILDEAFAGIATAKANAEKNLQNARALFESHLQSVFTRRGKGWVEKRLADMCSIARGGSPRPIQKFLTTANSGINWIKIGDATASGKYIYKTKEKIIPEGAKRSRVVRDGDFLLSNSMSFGRPYIMRTSGCIHDGWLVLTNYASQLDQDYLYYVLGSEFVFQQFDRLAAGFTVRNLNIELASRAKIPVPPLKQQQVIARGFDVLAAETKHLESLYQRKLTALESLKKSLLHQAFSGML